MRSVRDERIAVLWLCGPPGAGKSSAGMALYAGLARSGARTGFAFTRAVRHGASNIIGTMAPLRLYGTVAPVSSRG